MKEMMKVPDDTITGKDLDYLSDMFQWNYIAFKKTNADISKVTDKKISELLGDARDFFDDNLNLTLEIIENPGGELGE